MSKISSLARSLSDTRERAKAAFVCSILAEHDLVLAFDSRLSTLHYLDDLLAKMKPGGSRTMVITGSCATNKKRAKEIFGLESKEKGIIGLCSDAMSEGVNLQKASAVVLLDMPSVMRIAEQRIGRVDRMDSPYKQIEIYWPDDDPAFALKTDRKFFKTAFDVKKVLGSNIDIPQELLDGQPVESITGTVARTLYEERQNENEALESRFEDGIQDAFQPVRQLVSGPTSLIERKTYERLKRIDATVLSSVSIVKTTRSWGFFAIRGSDSLAPQWLFIDEKMSVHRELPKIASLLREYLEGAENLETFAEEAQRLLDQFLDEIQLQEIETLPNRRRRALLILRNLVSRYLRESTIPSNRKNLLASLQQLLSPSEKDEWMPDYYKLSQKLLDILQPKLLHLKEERGRKITHLRHVERFLKGAPLADDDLLKILTDPPLIRTIRKRIAACIIGVGGETQVLQHGDS